MITPRDSWRSWDHPVINDGITDQETKLVALLWGTNTYKPEYVDDVLTQTGIFVEEKTIRMPISGEVLLAVFRHRDRVTSSMDYLEHSVTFMEDVMGNPLPSNYLAVFFTDAIPEDVGGKHFGTPVRCAINADTGLPQELAQQMSEVTRQIAGLTNELESLLPRDRYIRDRPTNAPPAGCSDDDENWRSQGDEIASKSLATGILFSDESRNPTRRIHG